MTSTAIGPKGSYDRPETTTPLFTFSFFRATDPIDSTGTSVSSISSALEVPRFSGHYCSDLAFLDRPGPTSYPYRFQILISDIAGQDIHSHGNSEKSPSDRGQRFCDFLYIPVEAGPAW